MNRVLRFLLKPSFEKLLRIKPETKPEVYLAVFDGADIQNVNYWLELLLSAGIATLGLVISSPAVVIGAMLVSPLMGPLIAAGLSFAAADLYLGIKSLLQLGVSIISSILFAGLLVWILPLDAPTPEIIARTQPNLLDLGIALFSGLAGALLVSRSKSVEGGGAALPGVAIAVALMPPLCTVGFGLGAGFDWEIMYGAGLLFITNLAAIIASAFLVFYLLRMDHIDVRLAIAQPLLERASSDSIYHYLESKTAISRSFANIGTLRWRVAMIVFAIGVVLVPLSRSLVQLTEELVARDAVEEAVNAVTSSRAAIVSLLYDVHSDPIVVNLIVAEPVDPVKKAEAEATIRVRTNRNVNFVVRRVASEEELVQLRQGIGAQAVTPAVRNLDSVRADALARLEDPLSELWPRPADTLRSAEIGFDSVGIVVRLSYVGDPPLDETATDILRRGIQSQLGVDRLRLELTQLPDEGASP